MKNCIFVLLKGEYFYMDGKRLPYPYSAWLLKSPVLQKNKTKHYCHSFFFFPTEKARLKSLIFTSSKMPLFAKCRK